MLNGLALRLLAGAAILSAGAAAWFYVSALHADLKLAKERATTAQEGARMAQAAYQHLQLSKAKVDGQLAERERFQADLVKARRGLDDAVRTLLQTDKTVSQWAGQPVPDAIAGRLREHGRGGAGRAAGVPDAGLRGTGAAVRPVDQP